MDSIISLNVYSRVTINWPSISFGFCHVLNNFLLHYVKTVSLPSTSCSLICMEDIKISRKKPVYAVTPALRKYLRHYERDARMPIDYEDLLDFYETLPVMDKNGRDTLWETPIYPPHIQENLYDGLKI